jgi:hypothetical protein
MTTHAEAQEDTQTPNSNRQPESRDPRGQQTWPGKPREVGAKLRAPRRARVRAVAKTLSNSVRPIRQQRLNCGRVDGDQRVTPYSPRVTNAPEASQKTVCPIPNTPSYRIPAIVLKNLIIDNVWGQTADTFPELDSPRPPNVI